MRTYEETHVDGTITKKRSVILFDSFRDMLETNLKHDYVSRDMDQRSFYGVDNMQEAHELANKGLPRIGVEAIRLADHNVQDMQGQMIRPQFYDQFDVSGAVIDMGRYMEGTPECMVEYYPFDSDASQNIVSLILNVTYHAGISKEAITKNGKAMMALVEAIELNGKQAEIWTDMYVHSWGDPKYYARTAVRLKRAGEPFDVGMFMYALTHPSFLRAHMFNAMWSHPESYRSHIGITHSGSYGACIHSATHMDDFPPYSIYIPAIRDNSQAGKFVTDVLKQLNLLAA